MPNRIIKDSISKSEKISGLTDFQFRLWVHLITYVDDYGRGDARPAIIRGRAFPLHSVTDKQIIEALSKLETVDMIYLYTVGGKPYLQLKTWGDHQQIRATKSKYPKPEEADLITSDINCNQMISSDSKCSCNPIQSNPNPNPIREKSGRFTPPSLDEVKAYCLEHGYGIDPEQFINYYDSNGWMVGKNKMKDWKATVRTWVNRDNASGKNTKPVTVSQHPTSPNDEETERLKRFMESMGGE